MIAIGLAPLAAPTAREAPARPERLGDRAVAGRLARRDRLQRDPDALLERRAAHVERQVADRRRCVPAK